MTDPDMPLAEIVAHWRGLLKGHTWRMWFCWCVVFAHAGVILCSAWYGWPIPSTERILIFLVLPASGIIWWAAGMLARKNAKYCAEVLDRLEE